MSESFKIQYDRNRFPKRQRRDDGTFGCRGCGSDIPKKRQTWCSSECIKRYHPLFVRREAKLRDGSRCKMCGLDCVKAKKKWAKQHPGMVFPEAFKKWMLRKPPKAELDHIIPFSEGGLTVLENMRTLCARCHKKRTLAWHEARNGQLI